MKKSFLKIFTLSLCIIFLLQVSLHHFTTSLNETDEISIVINGKSISLDTAPVIVNGRTLVPARSVFEHLSANVTWNDRFQIVTITLDEKEIELAIDIKRAKINRENVPLEVAPKIINNRTMIPLRFVGEALNMNVDWNSNQKLITMNSISNIKEINLTKEGKNAIISINSSNQPNYKEMVLAPNNISPDRLVLDLLDSRIKDLPEQLEVYEYPIIAIRTSQLDELTAKKTNRPKDTVRIVFDLAEKSTFEIRELDKKLAVSISLEDAPKNFRPIDQSRGSLDREKDIEHINQEQDTDDIKQNISDNDDQEKTITEELPKESSINKDVAKDNEKTDKLEDTEKPEDTYIFKDNYDILYTKPPVQIFGDIEYHNFMDRVAIVINNSKLTDGRRELEKLYTSSYSQNPKQFTIEFDKDKANLNAKTIEIYDEFINTIQIENRNNKTKLIINTTKKYIYNVFSRSKLEDTAITLLKPNSNKERLVIIDPGHGGYDSGAIVEAFTEKELNLDMAIRLKEILDDRNIPSYMLRSDDAFLDLYERAYIANKLNASLFLSIHNNAYLAATRGSETLYYGLPPTNRFVGEDFARHVQNELVQTLGTVNRGLINRSNLVVLRETSMPAALAEIAFMTNEHDRNLLKNPAFRQASAIAMANAIEKSLESMGK